jgi:uncharacterized protein YdaU (DUF1376 family)
VRFNALWWWIDRWRKSTAYTDMTLEEQAAYRNLLDEATLRGGPIPNDERILAKACGDQKAWRRVRATVLARFRLTEHGWRNETLDEVIRKSFDRRSKKSTGDISTTFPHVEKSISAPVENCHPDPDPDPEQSVKSTAAPRRPMREPDEGTFGQYCVLAREARDVSLQEDKSTSVANVAEIFKTLCARRNFNYSTELAAKAIAAVMRGEGA